MQQQQTPLWIMPVPACLQHPLSARLYARAPQPQPLLSSVRSRPQSANSPRPQKRSRCRASTEAQTDEQSEVQIEGIDQNFCDDFVCTSSPAVERNLRALARDVVRTSTWTADLFADEVRYKVRAGSMQATGSLQSASHCWFYIVHDSLYAHNLQDKFRSTEGIAQYKRQTYLAGAVKDPKVVQFLSSGFFVACQVHCIFANGERDMFDYCAAGHKAAHAQPRCRGSQLQNEGLHCYNSCRYRF